ncbi:MAG: DUF429 domain-containing protein [Verrucomicrobiota bacterium]
MIIAGVDLAWGEKNPDGICLLEGHPDRVCCRFLGLSHGDVELLGVFDRIPGGSGVLMAIDAPVVCPNQTGARPVDGLLHRVFGKAHAGAYPANRKRCARPLRVVDKLKKSGFEIGANPPWHRRQVFETFPHPCTIRWFRLKKIFKYKKGLVAEKRAEFSRLQRSLKRLINRECPKLKESKKINHLLEQPWSKPIEDQTDAFMCALLAYQHWMWQGGQTEVLGTPDTGFVIVPKPVRG